MASRGKAMVLLTLKKVEAEAALRGTSQSAAAVGGIGTCARESAAGPTVTSDDTDCNMETPITLPAEEHAGDLPAAAAGEAPHFVTMQPLLMPTETFADQANETGQDLDDSVPLPKKRRRTVPQKQAHNKLKYPLLDPCGRCRKSCNTLVTSTERQAINANFWTLQFGERRTWMDGHVLIKPVKQRKHHVDQYTRTHTLIYHLPVNSCEKVPVCKTMFLHTLGLKTDGMVTEFVNSKLASPNAMAPTVDRRGKSAPSNTCDWTQIKGHINSFQPQISHYNREHSPNCRYLDPQLTITSMWKDYNTQHTDISYALYRRVFDSENVSFAKPSQDDCDVCAIFTSHTRDLDDSHDRGNCHQCVDGVVHLQLCKSGSKIPV